MVEFPSEAISSLLFSVGRFLINDTSSSLITDLFRFSILFWFSLGSFLGICLFLLVYPICWSILIHMCHLWCCISVVSVAVSLHSFLILCIWVFSFILSIDKSLSILLIFLKKHTLHGCFLLFSWSPLISALIFHSFCYLCA